MSRVYQKGKKKKIIVCVEKFGWEENVGYTPIVYISAAWGNRVTPAFDEESFRQKNVDSWDLHA